ncbi:putative acetyltransferase [Monaibacterium marinum]|uniref:Putative acetyltransferase n=1 Tax=Pontivivens marinum TaxID=1690039 RepID=A0A2C9CSD1_9RHOB|nr:GNAT family N-acetyltransferase [Monaibacterium marinum]SOH94123.1 putative acetyltransferase [Monaibacterium marinum]
MNICQADPTTPEAVAVLQQSWNLLDAMFPPEERFRLDLGSLTAPHVTFFLARDGEQVTGCAAFAHQGDGWGELKSMFVTEGARGSGAATGLLNAVQDCAMAKGCNLLRLETGVGLDAAHRFYAREGFIRIGPFGTYPDAPSSVFMEKNLARDSDDAAAAGRYVMTNDVKG